MNNDEMIAKIKAELQYLKNHRDMFLEDKKILEKLAFEKKEKEKILYKENKDVEKLEKTTITSLFHMIVGNKDEQLEKEKQEAFQASLDYHRVVNEFEMKLKEVKQLEARYAKEQELYEQLEQLQMQNVIDGDPQVKEKILQMRKQLNDEQSQLKEIDEALMAGEHASDCLEAALDYLRKAKNWGYYDMFGGDFLGTLMKHENLDQAQRVMQESRESMKRFQRELQDVHIEQANIHQFDSLTIAIDYIFDNFFVDWMVQSKINESYDQVNHQLSSVNKILNHLDKQKDYLQNQIKMHQYDLEEYLKRI